MVDLDFRGIYYNLVTGLKVLTKQRIPMENYRWFPFPSAQNISSRAEPQDLLVSVKVFQEVSVMMGEMTAKDKNQPSGSRIALI